MYDIYEEKRPGTLFMLRASSTMECKISRESLSQDTKLYNRTKIAKHRRSHTAHSSLVGYSRNIGVSNSVMVVLVIVLYLCLPTTSARSAPSAGEGEIIHHGEDIHQEWSANHSEVTQKIMHGLGLTSIPTKASYNVTQEEFEEAYNEYLRAVQEEQARQQYLEEVRYRELYGDEDFDEEEQDDVSSEDESYSSSPTVAEYKFYSNRVSSSGRGRGRRSLPNGDKIAHFHIAVPVASEDIEIVSAKASFLKKGTETEGNGPRSIALEFYRIDDIRKVRPKLKSRSVNENVIDKGNLLKKINITVAGEEWLEVNMTEAVRSWLSISKGETGVLIRCPECAEAGVTIRTGGASQVPVLHIQTQLMATRRVKRSKDMRRATRTRRRKLGDCKDMPAKGRHSSKCCKRSMTIRFTELPDLDFVISPPEFDAYYCSGRCPPRYNPANGHALLQSLVSMHGKEKIPKPCCSPTDLKGLHILHYGEDGKLHTTFWSDVIVTECGCA